MGSNGQMFFKNLSLALSRIQELYVEAKCPGCVRELWLFVRRAGAEVSS